MFHLITRGAGGGERAFVAVRLVRGRGREGGGRGRKRERWGKTERKARGEVSTGGSRRDISVAYGMHTAPGQTNTKPKKTTRTHFQRQQQQQQQQQCDGATAYAMNNDANIDHINHNKNTAPTYHRRPSQDPPNHRAPPSHHQNHHKRGSQSRTSTASGAYAPSEQAGDRRSIREPGVPFASLTAQAPERRASRERGHGRRRRRGRKVALSTTTTTTTRACLCQGWWGLLLHAARGGGGSGGTRGVLRHFAHEGVLRVQKKGSKIVLQAGSK